MHCNNFQIIFLEIMQFGFATNNVDELARLAKKHDLNYTRLMSKCT